MTLKIGWAGPWNPRSAIATFGTEVAAVLTAQGHRVEILRTEIGDSLLLPALDTPFPVRCLAEMDPRQTHYEYDVVVANIGDHFGYHGALAPFLLATDAVVIFHDAFLANFCVGWANQSPDPERVLRTMVTTTYGAAEMTSETPYWLPPEEMTRRRPMIELFAGHATAAVVHAGHYHARVAGACPGPVAMIPLAFRDPHIPPPRPPALPRGWKTGETLELATFGHVNRNKQIVEVIKAIGASDLLRSRCRYRVIGFAEPEEQRWIENEMRAHGVTEVVFTGWVNDETLRDLLAETDVICCLRNPIFEGGSASVIVAMLSGRAVLVSDHGVYGELPDDVVLKCRPGEEAADVRRYLEGFIKDRNTMWERGERARTHARKMHSPERYAHDLIDLVERAGPGGPASRTGMEFGRALASFGLGGEDPAVHRIAAVLDGMLGRPRG